MTRRENRRVEQCSENAGVGDVPLLTPGRTRLEAEIARRCNSQSGSKGPWPSSAASRLKSRRRHVFGPISTQLEGFSVTASEMVDDGEIVAAIGRYGGKGAANGVELDAEFVHVWRFGPDGKVTGFRTYTDTHVWRQALGAD